MGIGNKGLEMANYEEMRRKSYHREKYATGKCEACKRDKLYANSGFGYKAECSKIKDKEICNDCIDAYYLYLKGKNVKGILG